VPLPTTTVCSHPCWLRPRWHPIQQHLAQGPHPIRQSRCHGGRTGPPLCGRARPLGRHRLRERLAQGGVRQAEIIVHAVQSQLVADPVLALAEGAHSSPNGRHVLADGEVEAFHKRGIDLPAACCQHGVDTIERAEHHPVRHVYQAPAPYGLDHLRVEQTRPRQPARLRGGACGLAAWRLDPVAEMGEQRRGVLLGSVSNVEMTTPMALICKALFPSISTFETLPNLINFVELAFAKTQIRGSPHDQS